MPLAAAVKELSATFTGQLLQPGDAGYDDARRVHNGLIDKRPALVAVLAAAPRTRLALTRSTAQASVAAIN
jgi:hypothetical protein